MYSVLIYGAGSIGNHLAYACRCKGWRVTIVDIDPEALRRTKEEIYPVRYGRWDEGIALVSSAGVDEVLPDVVIIGTPPDTHMTIALEALQKRTPKVLLIEKPLCTPDLKGYAELAAATRKAETVVLTGYNHVHTRNTREAENVLRNGDIGNPLSISVRWLEHWGGIFAAHPWLSGPADTYLGFSALGGGACGEHSHGINLFQHFARILGVGRIAELSCTMDRVRQGEADFDRNCLINVTLESGLVGSIAQDVITSPAVKTLRVQGEKGFLEWYANYRGGNDAVVWGVDGQEPREILIPRKRPDDFTGEIDEVEAVLQGKSSGASLSLEAGYETMQVIAAAYRSHELKKTVQVEY
ncbi:Gfo/Idh/MocA family protein [Desulfonatronum thiodismutans]|uniref:Gfo/Idh/MocA family protein n=1 Tax=Desulfonatronum thiodismutans TaxID=159290 RepID=UPI0006899D74|nr:Gfo/Idh/MocA family oxidoreductase [Desulfonatronum thiodismutans]